MFYDWYYKRRYYRMITKCLGHNCEKKNECIRFTIKLQGEIEYGMFDITKEVGEDCKHYKPNLFDPSNWLEWDYIPNCS